MPPGGCGLPFAYVRTEYIAGVTDLLTRVDLASNPNEGVAARESQRGGERSGINGSPNEHRLGGVHVYDWCVVWLKSALR